jgi:hypothetical protein
MLDRHTSQTLSMQWAMPSTNMVLVTQLARNIEHWKCLVADASFLSQEGLAIFTRKDLYNIKLVVVVEKLTLGKITKRT